VASPSGLTALSTPPPGIPSSFAKVIAGGKRDADFPYIWAVDTCVSRQRYTDSCSVSYALAAGGLLVSPSSRRSRQLGRTWPGHWIRLRKRRTTFMDVARIWFDTQAVSGPTIPLLVCDTPL